MTNNKLKTIVSILAISIIGIVLLQLYWLEKSIETQKKTFDQNVNHVLRLVTDNIKKEEFVTILNYVSDKSNIKNELSTLERVKDSLQNKKSKIEMEYEYSYQTSTIDDSTSTNLSYKLRTSDPKTRIKMTVSNLKNKMATLENREKELMNKDEFIRRKIEINEDSTFEVHAFAFSDDEVVNIFSSKPDSNRGRFIRKKTLYDMMYNPILKDHKIDIHRVDSLLSKFLLEQGINTPYTVAIEETNKIDKSKKIVTLNNDIQNSYNEQTSYKAALFNDEFRIIENNLLLTFPDKESYIWFQAFPALVLSLFFISIVIFIFILIIRSMMDQKKISEMKNDFINNMTHELKTPISTIALASEGIVKNGKGSHPKISQYASIIYDENRRLSKQVEKILQISQIEKNQLDMDLTEFSLNEIITEAIQANDLRIEETSATLTTDLSADDDMIIGDKVHIRNVITNLLDNAFKYSRETPEIHISTSCKKGILTFSITDHGIGIPKESIEYIYDKFYRVPKGDVHDVKGFGLGLTYVKSIIEAHHFEIEIESKLNSGTTFKIHIDLHENKKEFANESAHTDG